MERIAATLKHGIILNSAMTRFFVGALVLLSVAFAAAVVATVYCYYLVILVVLFAILDGIAIKFVAHQSKAAREIRRWLLDALELEAFCNEVEGTNNYLENGSIGQVQVSFMYNGTEVNLKSQSGANVKFGMSAKFGTGTHFSEYVNKTVKILYSPRYNEVMFIKNQPLNEEQ